MPIESTPTNDSLVRVAFSYPEIAQQFFSQWIPAREVALFDWNSLQPQKIAGFTKELVERREDVAYCLKAKQGEVSCYILLEHQSVEDRFMPLRIFEYILLIWRTHRRKHRKQRTLPYVLPMVLYLGPIPWKRSTRLSDLIQIPKSSRTSWMEQFIPELRFFLVDLTGVRFEDLANGSCARAILAALQAERTKSLDKVMVVRILKELFLEKQKSLIKEIGVYLWTYLLYRSNLPFQEIEDIVSELIPPTERPNYMTTAEQLIEAGKQQGIEQGEVRALQASVVDVLQIRFCRVPEGLVEALKDLSQQKKLRELLRVAASCLDLETFAKEL